MLIAILIISILIVLGLGKIQTKIERIEADIGRIWEKLLEIEGDNLEKQQRKSDREILQWIYEELTRKKSWDLEKGFNMEEFEEYKN